MNLPWSQCFRCCLCQKLQRFAQQKVLPSLPVRQPRTWQTSWINSPDIVLYCRRVLFLVFAFLLHFINRINSRHHTCLYLSLYFINNFNQHTHTSYTLSSFLNGDTYIWRHLHFQHFINSKSSRRVVLYEATIRVLLLRFILKTNYFESKYLNLSLQHPKIT